MQLLGDDELVGNFQHVALGHGYSFGSSSTKRPVQHPQCTKENSYSGVAGQSYYSKGVTMTFARVLINQKQGDTSLMILAVQILNKLLQDDANVFSFPEIRNWINFEFDK